jgi:AcrR family transcriptional regulator
VAATSEALAPAASVASPPEVAYRKLRPGPGMSPAEVASHQRARIYGAMIEIVDERGYGAVTVRRLAQVAGVSTRTFYEHFQGKEDCLLRTYDRIVQRARSRIAVAQSGEPDWREGLRSAFTAFAREIEDEPGAARLALVDASAAGPVALERMRCTEERFEVMVSESFSRTPGGTRMPPLLVKGIVAGVSAVARAHLTHDGKGQLPGLADELLEWTLSLYDGAVAELGKIDRRPESVAFTPEPVLAAKPEENGRHSRDDDRPLILTATAKLAASRSYRELTVPRIRAAAGVSRRSFDSHFDNVEDCFLAALELRTADALKCASKNAPGNSWPEDVCRTMEALCARIAGDPALAALAFEEILAAGPTALRCREEMAAVIADRFRASAPPSQRPNHTATEASVGAIWGVCHHHVTSGRAQQLPRVSASLAYLALAPPLGAPSAIEAIRGQSQVKKHSNEFLD